MQYYTFPFIDINIPLYRYYRYNFFSLLTTGIPTFFNALPKNPAFYSSPLITKNAKLNTYDAFEDRVIYSVEGRKEPKDVFARI